MPGAEFEPQIVTGQLVLQGFPSEDRFASGDQRFLPRRPENQPRGAGGAANRFAPLQFARRRQHDVVDRAEDFQFEIGCGASRRRPARRLARHDSQRSPDPELDPIHRVCHQRSSGIIDKPGVKHTAVLAQHLVARRQHRGRGEIGQHAGGRVVVGHTHFEILVGSGVDVAGENADLGHHLGTAQVQVDHRGLAIDHDPALAAIRSRAAVEQFTHLAGGQAAVEVQSDAAASQQVAALHVFDPLGRRRESRGGRLVSLGLHHDFAPGGNHRGTNEKRHNGQRSARSSSEHDMSPKRARHAGGR